MVEDGDVFVLVDKDYFSHKQLLVAVNLSLQYLVYYQVDAPLEWGRGLFERVCRYPGVTRGLVRGHSLYEL